MDTDDTENSDPPWGAVTVALVVCSLVLSILIGAGSLGCLTENKDHYAAICSASELGNDAFAAVLFGGPLLITATGATTRARRDPRWLAAGCAIAAVGYLLALVLGLG